MAAANAKTPVKTAVKSTRFVGSVKPTKKAPPKPVAKKVAPKPAPKPVAKKPAPKPVAKKPAPKPAPKPGRNPTASAKKGAFAVAFSPQAGAGFKKGQSSRAAVAQWDRKPPAKGQRVALSAPAPTKFAYGLPGNFNIIGGGELNFDPQGFLIGKTELEVNRYRECELTHGRVGMLASVGFIIQESFHPLFSGVGGPAIDQIPQLPYWWWAAALGGITLAEFARIRIAFRELNGETLKAETALRPGYKPGQIGFDPLGLAPDDPAEFRIMQEKELAHARLGMIAAAGFLSQEAVTKTTWAVADGL